MNTLCPSADPIDSPSDVEIYVSPWVSGTRAAAYFGPVTAEIFWPDGALEDRSDAWEKAQRELLEAMRDRARERGANAVVGMDVTLDPFWVIEGSDRTGLLLRAVGTAAKLEPLF